MQLSLLLLPSVDDFEDLMLSNLADELSAEVRILCFKVTGDLA